MNQDRLAGRLGLAFALGAVHAAAFSAAPAWWLSISCLAALYALCVFDRTPTWRRAMGMGFAYGVGLFLVGVSWLYISMHRYGGMPALMAALALLVFAAYLALWPAAGCALAIRLSQLNREASSRSTLLPAFAFAAAQTLAELGRGYIFTGFPWLAAGYAQMGGPLEGLAPLVGVYGMGATAVLLAAAMAVMARSAALARRLHPGAFALTVITGLTGLAAGLIQWGEPSASTLSVRLVQGNVAQNLKFDPDRTLSTMQTYSDYLDGTSSALTVFPETAWTVPWDMTPAPLAQTLRTRLRDGEALAIGMPLQARSDDRLPTALSAGARQHSYTNSVAIIDRELRIIARYDKRHLVPFGEFVPWGFRWFVDLMHIPLGDFARGSESQSPFSLNGASIAFNICYEDLFGEELAVQVREGASVLVNLSNIAWFGQSHALGQHLGIARVRARELARPMLRATNTGVTAAIDHRGRVQAALPVHQSGTLMTQTQAVTGLTPYARYANGPVLSLSLVVLVFVAWRTRRLQA